MHVLDKKLVKLNFFPKFFGNRLNETFFVMVKSLNYFIKFIYGNGFKHFSPPKKVNEKRKPKHKKIIDGGRALFMNGTDRNKYIEVDLAGIKGKSLGAMIPYNLKTAPLMATLRIGRLERALGQEYVKTLLDSMGGEEGIIARVPTGVHLRSFILYHRPLAKEWYKMNKKVPTRSPSSIPSIPYHKIKNKLVSEYDQAKPYYRKDVGIKDLIPIIRARKKREIDRELRKQIKEIEKKSKTTTTREQPPQLKAYQARQAARKRARKLLHSNQIQQAAEDFQKVLTDRKNRIASSNKTYYRTVMDNAKTKVESRKLNEQEKKFVDELRKKFKEYEEVKKAEKTKKTRKNKKQPPAQPVQQPPLEKPTPPPQQESLISRLKNSRVNREPTRTIIERTNDFEAVGTRRYQRNTPKK